MMSGFPIVHIDFVTKDPAGSANFYQELFGWKIQYDPNFESYPMFLPESGPGGGFMTADGPFNPGDILLYADTPDLEGMIARAQTMGGELLVPVTEIPTVGWFAVICDQTGIRIGLFKGLDKQASE
jgi:uncharacterized protein